MKSFELQKALKKAGTKERARVSQSFFKTGPGQYGEGDIFLGVTVPETRKIALAHRDMSFTELKKSFQSKFHEERLAAILILVDRFGKSETKEQKKIYDFYLKHTKYINNWDLVDLSADKIVGTWLEDKPCAILLKLAKSKMLWERRIAILATFHFIKKGESKDALAISKLLLKDEQDLMHKAVGWMLREVGKRCSLKEEENFLKKHYHMMPRTMLRYAIERFPERKRQDYLKGRK